MDNILIMVYDMIINEIDLFIYEVWGVEELN